MTHTDNESRPQRPSLTGVFAIALALTVGAVVTPKLNEMQQEHEAQILAEMKRVKALPKMPPNTELGPISILRTEKCGRYDADKSFPYKLNGQEFRVDCT